MSLTTTIVVGDGTWNVPRGFGREYRLTAIIHGIEPKPTLEQLIDTLHMLGYDVHHKVAKAWTLRQRVEADVWSINTFVRNAGHDVEEHARPEWLPEPWAGPDRTRTELRLAA